MCVGGGGKYGKTRVPGEGVRVHDERSCQKKDCASAGRVLDGLVRSPMSGWPLA